MGVFADNACWQSRRRLRLLPTKHAGLQYIKMQEKETGL